MKNKNDSSPVTEKDDKSPAVLPSVVETINVTVDNSTDIKVRTTEYMIKKNMIMIVIIHKKPRFHQSRIIM